MLPLRTVQSVLIYPDVRCLGGIRIKTEVQPQKGLQRYISSETDMKYLFGQAVQYMYIQVYKLTCVYLQTRQLSSIVYRSFRENHFEVLHVLLLYNIRSKLLTGETVLFQLFSHDVLIKCIWSVIKRLFAE